MYRNGRGGEWTHRIRWYGEGKDCQENIRLNLEDPEIRLSIYPKTKEDADNIWFMFKQGAPRGFSTPMVQDFLILLKSAKPGQGQYHRFKDDEE